MPHHFAHWRVASQSSDRVPYSSAFVAAQDAPSFRFNFELANSASLSDPTHSLGMVSLCDDARSHHIVA